MKPSALNATAVEELALELATAHLNNPSASTLRSSVPMTLEGLLPKMRKQAMQILRAEARGAFTAADNKWKARGERTFRSAASAETPNRAAWWVR
jgi:hypothetical protein